MKQRDLWLALSLGLFGVSAQAGYYRCDGAAQLTPDGEHCNDGSIAIYHSGVRPGMQLPAQSTPPAPQESASTRTDSAINYFRSWQLYVPGTSYQTPGPRDGYDTLHNSAGTGVLHSLTIAANHSYVWKTATGRKLRGQWREGDSDYPIVLRAAYEGKDWKVGFDTRKQVLMVWDGFTWFEARLPSR